MWGFFFVPSFLIVLKHVAEAPASAASSRHRHARCGDRNGRLAVHIAYPMSAPPYLSDNEDIVFTSIGNYFNSDTLKYLVAP